MATNKRTRKLRPSISEQIAQPADDPADLDPQGLVAPADIRWIRTYRAGEHWQMWHATLDWLRDTILAGPPSKTPFEAAHREGQLTLLTDLLQNGPLRVVQYRRLDQQNDNQPTNGGLPPDDPYAIRPSALHRETM